MSDENIADWLETCAGDAALRGQIRIVCANPDAMQTQLMQRPAHIDQERAIDALSPVIWQGRAVPDIGFACL